MLAVASNCAHPAKVRVGTIATISQGFRDSDCIEPDEHVSVVNATQP